MAAGARCSIPMVAVTARNQYAATDSVSGEQATAMSSATPQNCWGGEV